MTTKKPGVKPNIIDKVVGYFNPSRGYDRVKSRAAMDTVLRHYDAATNSRRGDGWYAPSNGPNASIENSLTVLRNRSRLMVRNNPWMNRAVDVISANTVGAGIVGEPRLMDPMNASEQDKARLADIAEKWREWHMNPNNIDADSKLNFYGMQNMVISQIAESGEILARRRRRRADSGMEVPLQIQLMEVDHIDTSRDDITRNGVGNYVEQGIEFSPRGVPLRYWLFKTHPGETSVFTTSRDSVPVDAANIAHPFRPDRPGQVRGVPWGAPAMLRLHDLSDFEDAQLLRQKLAACFSVFVRDVDTSLPSESAKQELEELGQLEPGIIEKLPPGKTIEFPTPPGVDGDYQGYVNQQLRAVAASFGITFESLSNDLTGVNFSSGRMGWLEMHRNISQWRYQMMIPMFCERVWGWWKEQAELTGMNFDGIKMVWTPPRREMLDPVKETQAIEKQIRIGIKSLPSAIREHGEDPMDLFKEIAETNTLLDEAGIVLDSDPRQDKAAAAPEPAEGEDGNEEENDDADEEDEEERELFLDDTTGNVYSRGKDGQLKLETS